MDMIKGKVFLGLMTGFFAGTLLGALFANTKSEKDKKKTNEKSKNSEEDVVIKY